MLKLFHALSLAAALWALSDAPLPPPDGVFPDAPAPVDPTPKVDPAAVPVLTEGVFYVVKSDAPFLLYASPPGLVTISKEAGPIRLRGLFIDGSNKVQTKTFPQKCLAFVEAVPGAKGRVELIFNPVGSTDESKAIRRMVDVNTAPQPPPKPPEPDPKPPEPKPVDPPAPVTSFRVVWVHESGATVPQTQVSVMDSKTVRDYLTTTTTKDGTFPGWRRWDKDVDASNDFPAFKALWEGVKGKITTVPCVVIEINGKADVCPFPASPEAAVSLFKSKAGK